MPQVFVIFVALLTFLTITEQYQSLKEIEQILKRLNLQTIPKNYPKPFQYLQHYPRIELQDRRGRYKNNRYYDDTQSQDILKQLNNLKIQQELEEDIQQALRFESDRICKATGRCGCHGGRCGKPNRVEDGTVDDVEQLLKQLNKDLDQQHNQHFRSDEDIMTGIQNYDDSRGKFSEQRQEYEVKKQNDERSQRLKDRKQQQDDDRQEYDDRRQGYDDRRQKLDDRNQGYHDRRERQRDGKVDDGDRRYRQGNRKQEQDDRHQEYNERRLKYEENRQRQEDRHQRYVDRRQKHEDNRQRLDERRQRYDDRRQRQNDRREQRQGIRQQPYDRSQEYSDERREQDEKRQKYNDRRQRYDDRRQRYHERGQEYEDNRQRQDERRQRYDDRRQRQNDRRDQRHEKRQQPDDRSLEYSDERREQHEREQKYEDRRQRQQYYERRERYDTKGERQDVRKQQPDDRSLEYYDRRQDQDDRQQRYDDRRQEKDVKRQEYSNRNQRQNDRRQQYEDKTQRQNYDNAGDDNYQNVKRATKNYRNADFDIIVLEVPESNESQNRDNDVKVVDISESDIRDLLQQRQTNDDNNEGKKYVSNANLEDFVKYYEKVKKDMTNGLLKYIKGLADGSYLSQLLPYQKKQIEYLKKSQFKTPLTDDDLRAKIVQLIFGSLSNIKLLPHSKDGQTIYIPQRVHDALPSYNRKQELRSNKRLFPLTFFQKQRQRQLVPKNIILKHSWRRNNQQLPEYGVPFDLQVQGLGQIN